MSYILDALQKSEQQRKSQNTPDLMTVHPIDQPSVIRKMPWIIITLSLVILNFVGIGLWFFQIDDQHPVLTTTSVIPAEPFAPLIDRSMAGSTTQPVEPKRNPQPSVEAEQLITPANFPALDSNRFIAPQQISELPEDIQRQIPDLIFSSHLYSEDFRLVNINGQMMREDEYIAPELLLVEITEDGVILDFREHRISMSILQDWAFD